MMTNFNVIDDNFLFSDWHNEWENRQTLLDKKTRQVSRRFVLDNERMFFFKVTPKMIHGAFETFFQQGSIAAIPSPIDIGIMDMLIQSPKGDRVDARPAAQPPT